MEAACEPDLIDELRLALSRIIVTKQAGASLAWDVSHSRPHKKRTENDYDVLSGFRVSVNRLATLLESAKIRRSATVNYGDSRNLHKISGPTFNAIVTSPPYLNAIDYLRGHKLSLVWMGYTTPQLRKIRAGAIGTECSGGATTGDVDFSELKTAVPEISELPGRQQRIVYKYSKDSSALIGEFKRVILPKGKVVLVLGNSNIPGVEVRNSALFRWLAERQGFVLLSERNRPLQANRRYLPITANTSALTNRMKSEIIQIYSAPL